MPISCYYSTDANAPPAIANVNGNTVAVLDVLNTGYPGKAGAGWTIEQTATNKRGYRAPNGNRLYIGVDDTGTTAFRFRGFQTMSSAGCAETDGTGPFCTDTQISGGLYGNKSSNTTPRAWKLYTDGKRVYLFVDYAGNGDYYPVYFGDLASYFDNDNNCTVVIGGTGVGNAYLDYGCAAGNTTIPASYISRSYDGLGSSMQIGKVACTDGLPATTYWAGGSAMTAKYPDPATGGMLQNCFKITETYGAKYVERGRLPGLWFPLHDRADIPANTGDTISGRAGTALEGRIFEFIKVYSAGMVMMEISNPGGDWDYGTNFR